jgi:hypothetical protein
MSLKRITAIIAALILGAVLFYFYAGHQTPAGQPPLAELKSDNFTSIETAFNAAKNDVRLLVLLSPT